jgi:transposase
VPKNGNKINGLYRLRKNSILVGFVTGHDFSPADKSQPGIPASQAAEKLFVTPRIAVSLLKLIHRMSMRGDDQKQAAMFSYLTLAQRIPMDHPARQIRALADRALERMDSELEKLYSDTGRPSIAPERLLRATLLMILYSIRSERQLIEQMNYNLLFRWFVGLEMDDAVWDVTVFTKNRERLIAGAISQQ